MLFFIIYILVGYFCGRYIMPERRAYLVVGVVAVTAYLLMVIAYKFGLFLFPVLLFGGCYLGIYARKKAETKD